MNFYITYVNTRELNSNLKLSTQILRILHKNAGFYHFGAKSLEIKVPGPSTPLELPLKTTYQRQLKKHELYFFEKKISNLIFIFRFLVSDRIG